MNPFAPFAQAFGINLLVGSEISNEGRIYTEVDTCDMWLVQDGTLYYVVNAEETPLSEKYSNPAGAVQALVELDPSLPSLLTQYPLNNFQ